MDVWPFTIVLFYLVAFTKVHTFETLHLRQKLKSTIHMCQFNNQINKRSFNTIKQGLIQYSDKASPHLRGLKASKFIPTDNAVIRLPASECLAVPEYNINAVTLLNSTSSTQTQLSLLLLQEWILGNKSNYKAYINNLPSLESLQVNIPLHWPDEYLQSILPYEALLTKVQIQRKSWENSFNNLPPNLKVAISFERFCWAMEIVRSRSFQGFSKKSLGIYGLASVLSFILAILAYPQYGENASFIIGLLSMCALIPAIIESNNKYCILLPIIDSSNHRSQTPSCEITFDPIRGDFLMTSKQPIQLDEEVTISYGVKSNDDLLQYFGFVEEGNNNQNDIYIISNMSSKISEIILNWDNQSELGDISKRKREFEILQNIQNNSFLLFSDNNNNNNNNTLKSDTIIINMLPVENWNLSRYKTLLIRCSESLNEDLQVVTSVLLRNVIKHEMKQYDEDRNSKNIIQAPPVEGVYIPSYSVKVDEVGCTTRRQLISDFIDSKISLLRHSLLQLSH